MEEAFQAIDSTDTKRALSIGKKLLRIGYTGGFEVLACAYAADYDIEKAVQVLESGLEDAPTVWKLWELLGNYRSKLGRHDEVQSCYQRALKCPDVDRSVVHLNASISLEKAGRYAEALVELDRVEERDDLRARATSERMFLLGVLGRFDEALLLGRAVVQDAALWTEEHEESLATVYAELGRATWQGERDIARALEWAWKAIGSCKAQPTAARVIREARPLTSTKAHLMRLIVAGKWSEPFDGRNEPPGFFTTYWVVADSLEEALEFVRPFEPAAVRDTLAISSYVLEEPAADLAKGVHEALGGYTFFQSADHDGSERLEREVGTEPG